LEEEIREIELQLWRELGEQRRKERELATKLWNMEHTLKREGEE
jgi:hypothetical protein